MEQILKCVNNDFHIKTNQPEAVFIAENANEIFRLHIPFLDSSVYDLTTEETGIRSFLRNNKKEYYSLYRVFRDDGKFGLFATPDKILGFLNSL